MPSSKIKIQAGKNIPSQKLIELYQSVGWTAYTDGPMASRLPEAIRNSTYMVSAWDGDMLVGLARVLSDEVAIFYLQDLLVHPDHQGQGIGKALLQDCLDRFRHVRMKILLTDDRPEQLRFYETMGFVNTRDLTEAVLNTFVQFKSHDSPLS